MTLLGELALWIALPVALWGMVLGFAGGKLQRGDLVLSAERSVYAVFFLFILASAGVIAAFVTDRFDYQYVANYSNRELATYFKVSGLWAGQTGSLLFWALLLSFFSVLAVFSNRDSNREFMPYVVGVLQTIASFFLIVLLFAQVNPFERLPFTPANGMGLNPQLQNYWMTIHPPTLYLGFTSFTIPFAFAVAALLSGRLDSRWIVVTRKWTLLSWFFLANGIVFGMRWAYEELGWGGYWFWDPVENASLLPWLSATAFLHSIQIQEKRGMLKIWNMSLVILTFLLTIFATFLTRSGLIESVHSFAQNLTIAWIFLGFMGFVLGTGIVLILWRLPSLRSESTIESFISRESAFLFNNLILLGSAFAVMWGTLFPLITEAFGEKVTVGPPFFNRVNIPIGLVLLALTGIGPVIAWRKATRRNLVKNFTAPVGVMIVVIAALVLGGVDLFTPEGVWKTNSALALLTFGLAAFVLTVTTVEFFKGTKARAHIEGEGWGKAFVHLVGMNRRRWGGYVVHIGVVLIFAGFAGAAFDVDVLQTLDPGETVTIASPLGHSYTLTYESMNTSMAVPGRVENNLRWEASALLSVTKDGVPKGNLTVKKRMYMQQEAQTITEVDWISTPLEDLYVILADVSDLDGVMSNTPGSDRATFTVLVNPLVGWIWFGGMIVALGGLIAMWPERERVRRVASRPVTTSGRAEPAELAAAD